MRLDTKLIQSKRKQKPTNTHKHWQCLFHNSSILPTNSIYNYCKAGNRKKELLLLPENCLLDSLKKKIKIKARIFRSEKNVAASS